jgi:hypothetical protein
LKFDVKQKCQLQAAPEMDRKIAMHHRPKKKENYLKKGSKCEEMIRRYWNLQLK